jgi:hypothetical protein
MCVVQICACSQAQAKGRSNVHVRDDCARGLHLLRKCFIPLQPLVFLINQREGLVATKIIINIKVPRIQTTGGTDGEIYCKEKCNISLELWTKIIFMRVCIFFLSVCCQFVRTMLRGTLIEVFAIGTAKLLIWCSISSRRNGS